MATLADNAQKTAKEIIKETGIRNGLVMDALDKMEDVGTIQSDMVEGVIVYFLPSNAVAPAPEILQPVSTQDGLPEWDVAEARGYVLSIEGAFTPALIINSLGKQHQVNIYALLRQMEKQGILERAERGMYQRTLEQCVDDEAPEEADSILSILSTLCTDDEVPGAEDNAPSQNIVSAEPEPAPCINSLNENNTPLFGLFSDGSCEISVDQYDIVLEQAHMAALIAFFASAFGYKKVEA
ncbi:hypothetical protein [Snodgrassella sp. CFCC 13594]|uniref:hypothetical protein n=1 Tax=Snodgrassella sp. CFCC 13594 TaxID=1775559 RepID=UPI0012E95832|nr:hypothetical protein [Snodgrassella sp. CFCC 13594]